MAVESDVTAGANRWILSLCAVIPANFGHAGTSLNIFSVGWTGCPELESWTNGQCHCWHTHTYTHSHCYAKITWTNPTLPNRRHNSASSGAQYAVITQGSDSWSNFELEFQASASPPRLYHCAMYCSGLKKDSREDWLKATNHFAAWRCLVTAWKKISKRTVLTQSN